MTFSSVVASELRVPGSIPGLDQHLCLSLSVKKFSVSDVGTIKYSVVSVRILEVAGLVSLCHGQHDKP